MYRLIKFSGLICPENLIKWLFVITIIHQFTLKRYGVQMTGSYLIESTGQCIVCLSFSPYLTQKLIKASYICSHSSFDIYMIWVTFERAKSVQ